MKTGRNDPCPCGSGKKYKKCCLGKEEKRKTPVRSPAERGDRIDFIGMDHRQLIDQGYAALEKKVGVEACRLWWLAWPKLKAFIRENGVTRVEDLEMPVVQWCRDMERETAGVMDKTWVFACRRMVFAREFLELLPDSDASILDDMRRAVTGSREFLNGPENGHNLVGTDEPQIEELSADTWAEAYGKASLLGQYGLFRAIARRPAVKEFEDELDLGDYAVEVFDRLENNNLQEQALELADALHANWSEYYAREFYYFDSFLVKRLLYLGASAALPAALARFTEKPVDGIDYLLPLFGSLVAYQQRDVAIRLAEKVFPVVSSSHSLIGGAEYDFGLAVFADRLEKVYEKKIDWRTLNEEIAPFHFTVEPDMANDLDTLWSGGFVDLAAGLASDFGRALALLGFGFCRAMRERKGMGFPCGLFIWSAFESLIKGNDEQSDQKSFDFRLKALEDKVAGQLGLMFLGLSSRKTDAVILLWGLSYVYDYLYSLGLIDEALRAGVRDKVTQVKDLLFEPIGNDLWQYDFVRRWEPPDSADEDFRAYEAEVFGHSFSRRVPLSRNAPGQR